MNCVVVTYWYLALTMACVSGDGSYRSLFLNIFTIFIESLVKPVIQKKNELLVTQENNIYISLLSPWWNLLYRTKIWTIGHARKQHLHLYFSHNFFKSSFRVMTMKQFSSVESVLLRNYNKGHILKQLIYFCALSVHLQLKLRNDKDTCNLQLSFPRNRFH